MSDIGGLTMGDNADGDHTHEQEPPQIITPVVETESKLTAPLIDHEGKITRIEERQGQLQEENARQLASLEERLVTATGSQVGALETRIAELEAKMQAQAEQVEPEPEPEAVDLTLPDVENSPAPPEKIRQSLRERRKQRRKGKA